VALRYCFATQPSLLLTIKHKLTLLNKASGSATQLFPIGALTKGSEGRDMAELFDMKNCGAIAFEIIIKVKTMLICLKSRCNMYRILTD
jgi:hypothetical protein